ncbi:MAG: DUF4406 domain-containing protein [Firmicutes bacterium]|jgi:hypothetical protein|nr:DUF4406 domain-containing protein [Bacillota bacterium]
MKIYIAGAVTGRNYADVKREFSLAEDAIVSRGHEVINPLQLVPDPETSWQAAMRMCIKGLMDADAVLVINRSYETSKGVRLEVGIANALEMKLFSMDLKESKFNND